MSRRSKRPLDRVVAGVWYVATGVLDGRAALAMHRADGKRNARRTRAQKARRQPSSALFSEAAVWHGEPFARSTIPLP